MSGGRGCVVMWMEHALHMQGWHTGMATGADMATAQQQQTAALAAKAHRDLNSHM